MCGIVGVYNFFDKEPVSKPLLEKMCNLLKHRGPDDGDVKTLGEIGLGHRRLSIIDLSKAGKQPMCSLDQNIWIVFNGEIYNFLELREELSQKGYTFKSKTDTEVIIYLYKEYGKECFNRLYGMFAIAIWDNIEKKLILVRDRIGKKPLHYFFDGKRIIFASEIKSILEDHKIKREIDYQALYDYLFYLYIPHPKTIYKNIYKLPPGTYLICDEKGISIHEYWDVKFQNLEVDEKKLSKDLLELLEKCVRCRLISDVPLGAFLSGGIDSSAVVALMAKVMTSPVITSSIGFEEEEFNELPFARMIGKQFKTEHFEKIVKTDALNIIDKLVWHFDEPFADSSAVPTYYVSKLAKEKVTVALSGDGGDENFAGYHKYYIDKIENRYKKFAFPLIKPYIPYLSNKIKEFRNFFPISSKISTFLLSLTKSPLEGFYLTNTFLTEELFGKLINEDIKEVLKDYTPFTVTENYYKKADGNDHLSKILYVDLKTYLPGDILVKADRMSMANSLEIRSPFLDHRLIEFAAKIPSYYKLYGKEKKYILKKALEPILPKRILYREKHGFTVPLDLWFRKDIKEFAYQKLFHNIKFKEAGLLNEKSIKEIWDMHQKGIDFGTNLWSILILVLWYEKFI